MLVSNVNEWLKSLKENKEIMKELPCITNINIVLEKLMTRFTYIRTYVSIIIIFSGGTIDDNTDNLR